MTQLSIINSSDGYLIHTEGKPAIYLKDEKGNITPERFPWIDEFIAVRQVKDVYEALLKN